MQTPGLLFESRSLLGNTPKSKWLLKVVSCVELVFMLVNHGPMAGQLKANRGTKNCAELWNLLSLWEPLFIWPLLASQWSTEAPTSSPSPYPCDSQELLESNETKWLLASWV